MTGIIENVEYENLTDILNIKRNVFIRELVEASRQGIYFRDEKDIREMTYLELQIEYDTFVKEFK